MKLSRWDEEGRPRESGRGYGARLGAECRERLARHEILSRGEDRWVLASPKGFYMRWDRVDIVGLGLGRLLVLVENDPVIFAGWYREAKDEGLSDGEGIARWMANHPRCDEYVQQKAGHGCPRELLEDCDAAVFVDDVVDLAERYSDEFFTAVCASLGSGLEDPSNYYPAPEDAPAPEDDSPEACDADERRAIDMMRAWDAFAACLAVIRMCELIEDVPHKGYPDGLKKPARKETDDDRTIRKGAKRLATLFGTFEELNDRPIEALREGLYNGGFDGEDICDLGEVPSERLILAHAALVRLVELLDAARAAARAPDAAATPAPASP